MTIYGLIGLDIFLSLGILALAAWLKQLLSGPAQPETPAGWHPMLVRHGNLIESKDGL